MSEKPDLYAYLRNECPDLAAAKAWIRRWFIEWEQVLPWEKEPEFTLRAMSGHLSNVLEGFDGRSGYAASGDPYYMTRFGSELYWFAVGCEGGSE